VALRAAHGTGRPALVRVEVMQADELPPARPALTDRSGRGADGRFVRGNTEARAQRVHPGARGLVGLDKTDKAVRPFLAWGRRYASHRRRELAALHGGACSAGVGAMIESAGLALAASRYLHAKGAETGDPDLLKRASALANDARQAELASWELASREAAARPRPAFDLASAIEEDE
jgi:hypothetical protein